MHETKHGQREFQGKMKVFTKKNVKNATLEYIPMVFGLRILGFIRIHFRYGKRSPIIWLVLVVAPLIIGMITMSTISVTLLKISPKIWQLFFISLFLISLSFLFAERFRNFRRIYVAAIPAMVILNGLITLFFKTGFGFGSLVTFGILSALPAWILGKLSMGKGYRLLSDGADKNYRPGRDLYMDGQYEAAFAHLERSAKRGHMKGLYLIGHSYEHGNGRKIDLIKAAYLYEKASNKGYRKASLAYKNLIQSFSADQLDAYETDMSAFEERQLF